jgi:hypothetical protein
MMAKPKIKLFFSRYSGFLKTNKTDPHDISRNFVENGIKQHSPNPIQGSVWAIFTVNDSMFLTIVPISDTVGNPTESTTVDGINLDEIKEFAKQFKIRRLSLGLTQTQVGQALSATEGPAYSQSAICRSIL